MLSASTGLCITLLGLVVACGGCDRTDSLAKAPNQQNVGKYTSATLSPKSIVEQCVRSYQNLTSYEDQATVRLKYRMDGESYVDQAPFSVAWNAQGGLGLRVYSVQAGPQGSRWRLRLGTADSAGQVLSRESPAIVNFQWLLSDPSITDCLSAGLAGFPPQLDLLLNPMPLSGLVNASATLALEPSQEIDGRDNYVVVASQAGLAYRMWIDQSTFLLRRLQVPNENLGPDIFNDPKIEELSLTVELDGIRTNADVDWSRFAVTPDADDRLVTHFVKQPISAEADRLGIRIPAFQLHDTGGNSVYTSVQNALRKATVMIWLADHPACRVASQQLAEVVRELAARGVDTGAIEIVSVWAEPRAPQGSSFNSLAADWSLPGKLALDTEALGRDLFGIAEAPSLVVLDANNRLQFREVRANPVLDQVLPAVLTQVLAGVDLASVTKERNANLEIRHQAELAMAAAVDGESNDLPDRYDPIAFRLIELATFEHADQVIATATDEAGNLWTLSAAGLLEAHDPAGMRVELLKPAWGDLRADNLPQLYVAGAGKYFALSRSNSSDLSIFDKASERSLTLNLGTDSLPVDARWLELSGSRTPRLAVVTSDSRTVLLDPSNHEQLSGKSQCEPCAVFGYTQTDTAVAGLVILKDRSVEQLQLSEDSTLSQILGRPRSRLAAGSKPSAALRVPEKLAFLPRIGAWLPVETETRQLVLASGWLAAGEPCVFLLDETLGQLWHYRMPLEKQSVLGINSVCKDPVTGQPVWAISSDRHTIHLLRADGLTNDHFRMNRPVLGASLIASGHQLLLRLVTAEQTISFEVRWNL